MDRDLLAAGAVAVVIEVHSGPLLGRGYGDEVARLHGEVAALLERAVGAMEAVAGALADDLDVAEVKQQEHRSEERRLSCTRPLRRLMPLSAVAVGQALGALPSQSLCTTALDGYLVASPFDQQVLTAMAQQPALAVALLGQVFGLADVGVPSIHPLLGVGQGGTAASHLAYVTVAESAFAVPPLQEPSGCHQRSAAARPLATVPAVLAAQLMVRLVALESGNLESIFALRLTLCPPGLPPTTRPYLVLRYCHLHSGRMRTTVHRSICPRSSTVPGEESMGCPPAALACTAPYIYCQDWLDIGSGKDHTSPGCTGIVAPAGSIGNRGTRNSTFLTGV